MHGYKVLLSQLVKVLCLSEIITEAPFPSVRPPLPPVQFLLVMFRTPAILVRLFQKPLSQHSVKDCPLLLCCLASSAQDTWQSH